jgi:hypothetical protein
MVACTHVDVVRGCKAQWAYAVGAAVDMQHGLLRNALAVQGAAHALNIMYAPVVRACPAHSQRAAGMKQKPA